MHILAKIWAIAGLAIFASPALADPCKAIPDKGPVPAYLALGSSFTGPVVYIGDGDSLCIDVGKPPLARHDEWVEVRIADFYAPELHAAGGQAAKLALEGLVQGETLTCIAGRQVYDRVVATCTLQGRPVGDLLRAAGAVEGGNGRKSSRRR